LGLNIFMQALVADPPPCQEQITGLLSE